ncbi:hypothetical protein [Methylicorpusculum sp.]|uniref:hypothetical protein n=1 Tax=Methylicorpusculum sp. TaxID=2713644 RepID=UPI0027318DC0|nr:hypothetical protein [Methylicorpusculum sp.]MDP2179384.1 hypothetical protein [Methylicorpusculum sp.]MDP3529591.1 hypothetical protein [Methylicorpusculum sp.]MDZ4153543.1 hypothetical protein [Methylicorpusculum sp.]
MTEVLFILTTIYVAYVVYLVVGEKSSDSKSGAAGSIKSKVSQLFAEKSAAPSSVAAEIQPAAQVSEAKVPEAAKTESVAVAEVTDLIKEPAAPTPEPAPAVEAKPKAGIKKPAAAAKKPAAAKAPSEVRNPETGEVNALPNNYRFAKRWMKDALVKEGLLPKVYKNDELDEKANKKIKTAFTKFAKLEQYRV